VLVGISSAIKIKTEHVVCSWSYLCVKIVLVDPSAPTDRALQCIGLILCRAIARAPHTFTTSACHRSDTGSIDARERTRRRTERGEEMLLVIVGRADMVDQVVADVLRAERTPSRLFYSVGGLKVIEKLD
jgi:hypothetical protein